MSIDWASVAISLAIIALVLLVHWRGQRVGIAGTQAGTGSARQINKLFAEVSSIKDRVEGLASRPELTLLASQLKALEQHAASSGEVYAVEGKINALRSQLEGNIKTLHAELQGVAKAADRTEDAVQRIEGILIKQALGGK